MKMKIMFRVIGLLAMVIGIAFSPVKAQTDMKNAQPDSQTYDSKKNDAVYDSKKVEGSIKIHQPTTGMKDIKQVELQAKTAKKKGDDTKPLTANLNFSKSNINRTGCYIDIDNKTDDSIDLYINGTYRGRMPKSGKYTMPGSQTSVEVYFKTDSKDGTYQYWGPQSHNCGSKTDGGNVHYTLNP